MIKGIIIEMNNCLFLKWKSNEHLKAVKIKAYGDLELIRSYCIMHSQADESDFIQVLT